MSDPEAIDRGPKLWTVTCVGGWGTIRHQSRKSVTGSMRLGSGASASTPRAFKPQHWQANVRLVGVMPLLSSESGVEGAWRRGHLRPPRESHMDGCLRCA